MISIVLPVRLTDSLPIFKGSGVVSHGNFEAATNAQASEGIRGYEWLELPNTTEIVKITCVTRDVYRIAWGATVRYARFLAALGLLRQDLLSPKPDRRT